MTQYDRGRRFEWKTRTLLRGDGYRVIRGAGSKGLDLIALKPGQILYVGCKLTRQIGAAEWDDLRMLADWAAPIGVPLLAVNGPLGRGVDFWRLEGPKRRGLPWPKQPVHRFVTDEVAGVRQEWVEIP